jgi:hypothetical protein
VVIHEADARSYGLHIAVHWEGTVAHYLKVGMVDYVGDIVDWLEECIADYSEGIVDHFQEGMLGDSERGIAGDCQEGMLGYSRENTPDYLEDMADYLP